MKGQDEEDELIERQRLLLQFQRKNADITKRINQTQNKLDKHEEVKVE